MIPHRCSWNAHYRLLRHHCPIGTCSWYHEEDDERPRMFDAAGRPLDIGADTPDIGSVVEAHAARHSVMEWAREVDRLQALHRRAEEALTRRGIEVD